MRKKAKTILPMMLAAIMAITMMPEYPAERLDVKTEAKAATITLNNPKIEKDPCTDSKQKVTWDCIYFGSYPQTEIVDSAETSGCYGKSWSTSSDYEVDKNLYEQLTTATYNENGDTRIGNNFYRRILSSDATYVTSTTNLYTADHFNWSNNDKYHYFRYDPIKWRVLNVNGEQALLLADVVLDNQQYNRAEANVTWETSTIRKWLNGYESSSNTNSTDYSIKNFIDSAFTADEKNAILTTSLVNEDSCNTGAEGGNDTDDKIFLLSQSDVYKTNTATSYGFMFDYETCDEARKSKSSTFAKAMGIGICKKNEKLGNASWWLRSPGDFKKDVQYVTSSGDIGLEGCIAWSTVFGGGCRPALNLNLSASELYSYAGTACSDEHKWDDGIITTAATCTETGEIKYTCTECGKSITKEIPATNHPRTECRNVKKENCKEEGYTGDIYCKDCGFMVVEGTVLPKNNNHIWDKGVITKQASVNETGIKTYTCTVCGTTQTVLIPQLQPAQSRQITQSTQITQPAHTTIVVPGTSLTSAKNAKGRKLTIKWKKNTNVNGYLVQMSTNKAFTSGVIQKMIYSNQTASLKSSKLKNKKIYYIRVCTYLTSGGQVYYSNWSNVKKVKIKK